MTIVACPAASLGSPGLTSDEERTEHEQKMADAKEEMQSLEEDPPDKLEDWPEGQAKYETFGGGEGDHSYAEGPEQNLGPDSVRHLEDGSVEVAGEKVDDPEEFKGEPIPGGPTDPDSKDNPDAQRLAEDDEQSKGDDSGEGEDEESAEGEEG
jgi:hypothetical protein